MKKVLSIITLALCGFSAEALAQSTLTVKLEGLSNGTQLILADGADPDREAVYTATLQNGAAKFNITATDPRAYRLLTAKSSGGYVIAVGPGENVALKAKVTLTDSQGQKKYFNLENPDIKGGTTHSALKAAEPDHEALNKDYEAYHNKHKAIEEKVRGIQRSSEEWKAMEATPEWKAFEADEHAFFQKVEATITGAIKNNSNNWMGPYFMLTQYSYLTADNRPEYDKFTPEVQQSFYGKQVADKVVPMSTNEPMPDFTFTDYNTGKKMSLLEICKQNKYVLIDFWASWCNPCRKEIPNFKAMYEKYKDQGFQVISISADSKKDAWLKALEEEKLEWPNDIDGQQGICKLFKVQFYPTVYLLDSNAKVIVSNEEARGEKLRNKLAELFGK